MAAVRAVSGALGRAATAASRCAYHSLASAARPAAGSLPAWLASNGSTGGVDRIAPSLGDVPPAAIGDCDADGSGWDRQRLIRDSVIGDFDGAVVPRGLPLEEGGVVVGDGGSPAGGGVSIEAMNRNAREGTKVRTAVGRPREWRGSGRRAARHPHPSLVTYSHLLSPPSVARRPTTASGPAATGGGGATRASA
jgi:hypothetical protein